MNQKTLLDRPDNSFRRNFATFNFPSPYQDKESNFGKGVMEQNRMFELNGVPREVFEKHPFLREPTNNNPFMNVTPVDYDEHQLFSNYNRYKIGDTMNDEEISVSVSKNFEKGLIQDPDSVFWNRLNSQRQFYSVPSGSVPNNQGEFASWLWGIKNNCKAGSIYANYGIEYNDDSLLCTGYSLPVMSNKGTIGDQS